jgi:hypothetical protein
MGMGRLCFIEGTLDAKQYKRILQNQMIPSGEELFNGHDYLFQQDNDPKHKAKLTTEFLETSGIDTLPWPPQSPDLNPIENLWSILDDMVKDRRPSNEAQLFEVLQNAWNNVNDHVLHSLVASMPRRCQAIIANNGYATKY